MTPMYVNSSIFRPLLHHEKILQFSASDTDEQSMFWSFAAFIYGNTDRYLSPTRVSIFDTDTDTHPYAISHCGALLGGRECAARVADVTATSSGSSAATASE